MSTQTRKPIEQPSGTGRAPERAAVAAARRRKKTALRWALGAGLVVVLIIGAYLVQVTPGAPTAQPYVGGDLHSLVVDPTNPDRVLVGGHDGAALSADGGKTWRQLSGLRGADVMGWVIDPRHPRTMYAAGHPGFYRSSDGGARWTTDNAGLPATDVHGLGMDPRHPNVLFASVVGQGLVKSADAGARWAVVNTRVSLMGPILVDPRASNILHLADGQGSFDESVDGGATWRRLGMIPGGMTMWVSQDQRHPSTFYAANGSMLKSTDGGTTWQQTGAGLSGSPSAVAVAPHNSGIIYAGVLNGTTAQMFRSQDGGAHWQARN